MNTIRLPVHGHMMSITDVAEAFGISYHTVWQYRDTHRDADGKPMPLEAVYDHYAAVKRGDIPRFRGGCKPKRHLCAGRYRTVAEAARALGVTTDHLYTHMCYHKCSLDEAWRHIDRYRTRRAERKIMEIIMEG